jgi:hypothetical protein
VPLLRLPGVVLLVICCIAVLLAGCGNTTHSVRADSASALVLRDGDLAAPFSAFYAGAPTRLDTAGTSRASATRYGRKAGWIARFHRAGSPQTRGPLVVESRADVFADSRGATRDLAAYRRDFAAVPGDRAVAQVPRVGDETTAWTSLRTGTLATRFYRIAWRDRNVTASIVVDGFAGKVTLVDAVTLARAQEVRIAAAP